MFVIFTTGLVLTVCVMRTGAEGCGNCCEHTDNESFKATIGLGRIIRLHTTAEKTEKNEPSLFVASRSDKLIKVDQLLDYDMVNTNSGNSFRPEFGMFMAPFNGSYFFNVEAASDNMFELGIVHNEEPVGKVSNGLHSTIVIREMVKNDIIYVKVNMAQDNTTLSHCTVSGFHIYRY